MNTIAGICSKNFEIKNGTIKVSDTLTDLEAISDINYIASGRYDTINVHYNDESFKTAIIYASNIPYFPVRIIFSLSDKAVIWNPDYKTIVITDSLQIKV